MAVIRAKRLWIDVAPPAIAITKPAGTLQAPPDPQAAPRAAKPLYTCPPGKRAIIRSINTFIQGSGGAATPPTSTYYLRPANTVDWAAIVHWRWYTQFLMEGVWQWDYSSYWNGQLVLHSGDRLEVDHTSTTPLHTTGSGHELNDITS